MKRLILTRHAKSDWSAGTDDHARPLNLRGQRAATALGDWLRSRDLVPDQALVSTAARTQETWEKLGFEATPMVPQKALYHASPETILEVAQKATGQICILIGHNPGLGEFAGRILSSPAYDPEYRRFPTAATAVIELPDGPWSELAMKTGVLADFQLARSLTD